jgi:spore maturation protein CgeB
LFNKKILHFGPFFEGSTVLHRHNALKRIFISCQSFNTNSYLPTFKRGIHSIWRKLSWGPPISKLNKDLILFLNIYKPDLIFFEKNLYIYPSTLNYIKQLGIVIIHFSTDDQFNPNNQTFFYLNSIKIYDFHITTKSYNVNELYLHGAKSVFFVNNATDESIFKPIINNDLISQYNCDVGFIGTWEKERADSILYLANNDIKVRVWGPGWKNKRYLIHPNIFIENKYLIGQQYIYAINATKINLNFLRKENRDLQTTRSIEIPACNAFMLAEFSNEHATLFEEDKEAVFFRNNTDLLTKVIFYLENDTLRNSISKNGFNRCINSNYFYYNLYLSLFNNMNIFNLI